MTAKASSPVLTESQCFTEKAPACELFQTLPGDLQGAVLEWLIEPPHDSESELNKEPFTSLENHRELWSRLASRHFRVNLQSWIILEKSWTQLSFPQIYESIWETQHHLLSLGWSLLDSSREDVRRETSLQHAARFGKLELVQLLLRQPGVDVNHRQVWGATALMFATVMQHVDMVQLLLEEPVIEVNFQDLDGVSALSIAATIGNPQLIQLLLAHPRIDVNLSDHDGWTPLMMAADNELLDVVLLLLKQGADPSLRNERGETLFDLVRDTALQQPIQNFLLLSKF